MVRISALLNRVTQTVVMTQATVVRPLVSFFYSETIMRINIKSGGNVVMRDNIQIIVFHEIF